jgi:hypothetical protein
MKAEPMMPKACSIPCRCKTFTKASSVVILILSLLTLSGAPRARCESLRPGAARL